MRSAARLCSLAHPVFTLYCTTGKPLYDTTGCNFTSTLPILSYTSLFQPTTTCNLPILLLIEECSTDLDKWTSQNKLKFKKDKTELLYMYSKYNPQQCLPPLRFGTDTIQPAQSARNIDVILDSTIMTMLPHVDSVCKISLLSSAQHFPY